MNRVINIILWSFLVFVCAKEFESTLQKQVTGKKIDYMEESDFRDPRTKFIIRILDFEFNLICCGCLLNNMKFIAPTDCIKSGAYFAYVQTNILKNFYDSKEIVIDDQCNSEIPKDLMIAEFKEPIRSCLYPILIPATFTNSYLQSGNSVTGVGLNEGDYPRTKNLMIATVYLDSMFYVKQYDNPNNPVYPGEILFYGDEIAGILVTVKNLEGYSVYRGVLQMQVFPASYQNNSI